jgi:hypothetical protein
MMSHRISRVKVFFYTFFAYLLASFGAWYLRINSKNGCVYNLESRSQEGITIDPVNSWVLWRNYRLITKK